MVRFCIYKGLSVLDLITTLNEVYFCSQMYFRKGAFESGLSVLSYYIVLLIHFKF